MFTSFELFDDEDNEENNYKEVQIIRKNLRNNANILELPDPLFLKTFRLTKGTFTFLLRLLDLSAGARSTRVPPILQLAATLNLLGGGGYQRQVGADWSAPMGQSTVAKISAFVIKRMQAILCPLMIKFVPKESTKQYFVEKFKVPGVIGCIDGSHVMILRPTENENMFFNRKGRHIINAMFICDEKTRILAVNARYGGSAHDSFIWRQSDERAALENVFLLNSSSSWLLGDSGYPLEPFLMTPYRNATENSPELHFNLVHSQTRSIIERCIGRLKSRWRIILEERKCRYSPLRVAEVINICAALQNLCCDQNVPHPEEETNSTPMRRSLHALPTEDSAPTREAKRIRDSIKNDLFVNRSL